MRFLFNIAHVPRKDLTTAGALSRAPLIKPPPEEERRKEVRAYVSSVIRYLPGTDDRLKELRDQLQQDAVTRQIMTYCTVSGELTVLMKGSRLVIPISMRLDILDRLHEEHKGITRCG